MNMSVEDGLSSRLPIVDADVESGGVQVVPQFGPHLGNEPPQSRLLFFGQIE